ncbi:TolC family protein [Ornithobacterium rhinotracheale]
MNTFRFIFLWIIGLSFTAFGQKIPQNLSLTEAQTIGLKNNAQQHLNQVNLEIARAQTASARTGRIPSISGSANFQRNLIIPATPVPAKAFNPQAKEGEIDYMKFATPWALTAGVKMEYPLFDPTTKNLIYKAEKKEKLSEIDNEIESIKLKGDIAQNYIETAIAQKQWELAQENIAQENENLRITLARFEAGRATDYDKNSAKMQVNNAESQAMQAQNILNKAKLKLLASMGVLAENSGVENLNLTDSLEDLMQNAIIQNNGLVAQKEETSRLSIQKNQLNQEIVQSDVKKTKADYLPRLSLNAFLGTNHYSENLNIFENKHWRGNSYIALGLNVPISEAYATSKKLEELNWQAQQLEKQLLLDSQNRIENLATAQQEMNAKKTILEKKRENINLAKALYENKLKLYNAGRLLSNDLAQTKYLYQQAQTEYLQSVYDYLSAVNQFNTDWEVL